MLKARLPSFSFIILLCIAGLAYLPGLKGDFIFDDFYNLEKLGVYGPVTNWDAAKSFILSGESGPTGRPIAMASFLLDSNNWPTSAAPFKLTNLWIHLFCGSLLYLIIQLLLHSYNYSKRYTVLQIKWIAVLAAGIWLLHPMMVSTTLYVVQRMTQLSTLFSLLAILGYLYGRKQILDAALKAYVIMTLSIIVGTLLATYSKENGALLPLLVLVFEFCNPDKKHKPSWQWRLVVLWIPSFAVSTLLLSNIDFSANPWPNRPFNQIERLLTEGRIVCEYLFNLFIPKIEGSGLFQDGYIISKNLFTPWNTLLSIIVLAILGGGSFLARKKYPLLALGVLFFFAAHLMESTILGLELYFEHRNYLAATFLFVPFAEALISLTAKIKSYLVLVISVLLILTLSWMTWQRAILWGDSVKLELFWAYNNTNSARAQAVIADKLMQQERFKDAQLFLEAAQARLPDNALLSILWLLSKVREQEATEQDFVSTSNKLVSQPFDAQAIALMREFVENNIVTNKQLSKKYAGYAHYLIEAVNKNPAYNQFPVTSRLMHYLKAKLLLAQNQPDLAYLEYSKALYLYKDTEAGLEMTLELYKKGYFVQALKLLNETKLVYKRQDAKTLQRSHQQYDIRLNQLSTDLQHGLTNEYGVKSANGLKTTNEN